MISKGKFVASFSGGKDSVLSIYRAITQGYKPIGLITTYDEQNDCSWFHSIPQEVLFQISESLNIPLTIVKTKGEQYAFDFEYALTKYRNMGAELCVFGDVDIDGHFDWCDKRCKSSGLKSYFPLWHNDRKKLVIEFIKSGFKAVITTVNTKMMNEKYIGQTLSEDLIKSLEADCVDVCGENGEYHTVVYDGPIFKSRVELIFGEAVASEGRVQLPMTTRGK